MKLSTALQMLRLLFTHPEELRSLITFYLWHEQKRDLAAQHEHPTSGWDRASMRKCWEYLTLTSRSFSAVIKELDGDLARTVCLFYLVLRGLDTIEDDTTLPDEVKQPMLRSFHEKLSQPGWCFDGIREQEKDRKLLVDFGTVVEEVMLMEPKYKDAITDICLKMETGMADFCHRAATSSEFGIESLQEYDLYCHYVAGLVGEGLSRLFAASGKEALWIGDELVLSNSMGFLLQKTNILRDFREDVDQGRLFWPKEIWSRYGFTHPREMYHLPNEDRALWALSEMTLDALRHAVDALDYLTLLKNQSVFNFCAIPATMALATLELCFMNKNVLHRNVKIRKGQAASSHAEFKLIMRSTNPREVAFIFQDFARKIHAKALTSDPNFIAICVVCGKIEQWVERHYPSFVAITGGSDGVQAGINESDVRARIVKRDREIDLKLEKERRGAGGGTPQYKEDDSWPWELFAIVGGAMAVMVAMGAFIVWLIITYFSD
ncbi:isoprenoid synthase domain-containing protein [Gautieria morchelliformis]|nr:isoprenoid synthase domain-containing protein [Gautieria morchelliformis]